MKFYYDTKSVRVQEKKNQLLHYTPTTLPLRDDGRKVKNLVLSDGEIAALDVSQRTPSVPKELRTFTNSEDNIREHWSNFRGKSFAERTDHDFHTTEHCVSFPLNVSKEDKVTATIICPHAEDFFHLVLGDAPVTLVPYCLTADNQRHCSSSEACVTLRKRASASKVNRHWIGGIREALMGSL